QQVRQVREPEAAPLYGRDRAAVPGAGGVADAGLDGRLGRGWGGRGEKTLHLHALRQAPGPPGRRRVVGEERRQAERQRNGTGGELAEYGAPPGPLLRPARGGDEAGRREGEERVGADR